LSEISIVRNKTQSDREYYMHRGQKAPLCFLEKLGQNEPILIIFGTLNPDEITQQKITNLSPDL